MKTLTSVFVCAALAITAVLMLSACGDNKNAEIAGKWVPATATINGETIQFSELNSDEKSFEFVFEENGSCQITIAGTTNNGTYTFNSTSVDIEYGGKQEKLIYADGMLTLNLNYNNETTSFMFTRATE